jgi:NAD(P)-dependent dehydrogenase (short-subunit alcohol dehydrogenase family)
MQIAEKTVLITGANRGIGEALVKEALNRGAKKVFAGTRGTLSNTDPRVTALTLEVTNASQIQRASDQIADLDVLILRSMTEFSQLPPLELVNCGTNACVTLSRPQKIDVQNVFGSLLDRSGRRKLRCPRC